MNRFFLVLLCAPLASCLATHAPRTRPVSVSEDPSRPLETAGRPGTPTPSASQEADGEPAAEKEDEKGGLLPEKLRIRRSRFDRNFATQPATFVYTNPEDGENSSAADLALVYEFDRPFRLLGAIWEPSLSGEYHRNTRSGSEQDSLLVGAGLRGSLNVGNGVSFLPRLSLDYRRDRERDTESGVLALDVPINVRDLYLGAKIDLGSTDLIPRAGVALNHAQVFEVADGADTGDVTRGGGYLGFEWNLDPDPPSDDGDEEGKGSLVLTIEESVWYDLAESSALDSGTDKHDLFRAGLTAFLDEDRDFGVTLEFLRGADPTTGLEEQTYVRFGLSVRH